jgi:hypothetical protein
VLVHDIVTHGGSSSSTNKTHSLSLQLRHLLLTPPLGRTLSQLRSVVLPLHGPVLVGPGDGVVELPYVGDVGLVSPADNSNANIQEVPGGFVIRGLVSANPLHDALSQFQSHSNRKEAVISSDMSYFLRKNVHQDHTVYAVYTAVLSMHMYKTYAGEESVRTSS